MKSPGEAVSAGMRSFIETYKPKCAFIVYKEGEDAVTDVDECRLRYANVRALISELKKGQAQSVGEPR